LIHAPPTPFGVGMESVPTGDLITKNKGLIRWFAPNTVLSCVDTRDLARDDLLLIEEDNIQNGKTYVSVGFHASIHEILKEKAKHYNTKPPMFVLPNFSLVPMFREITITSSGKAVV